MRQPLPILVLLALTSACKKGPPSELRLRAVESEVSVPIDSFDVFLPAIKGVALLSDPPETFQIRGPGVDLVGEIPLDARVTSELQWKLLIGRELAILQEGGNPDSPVRSGINTRDMPGNRISSGSVKITQVGDWKKGATPLSGTITLRFSYPNGSVGTSTGTFDVLARTIQRK